MTGLTRQQAAEAVAALFGTTASHSRSSRTYDPWEVTDNEGKTWRFVFDASIRATMRGLWSIHPAGCTSMWTPPSIPRRA